MSDLLVNNKRFLILFMFYCLCSFLAVINPILAIYVFVCAGFFLALPEKLPVHVFVLAFPFFLLMLSFNFLNFDPIGGPDEQAFYQNFKLLNFGVLVENELDRLDGQIGFISSRNTFAGFLSLITVIDKLDFSPIMIVIANTFFWFLAISIWIKSIESYFIPKELTIITLVLLVAPSSAHWLGNFGKDVFSLALCMICAAKVLDKKWGWAIIVLAIASLVRPYAVVIVFALVLPFILNFKQVLAITFGSFITFIFAQYLLFKSVLIGVANSVITFVYIFISPNPVNASNWDYLSLNDGWQYSPILFTIEGIVFGAVLILSAFQFLLNRNNLSELFYKVYISIMFLCLILVFVGMLNLQRYGEAQMIGSLGDNFIRKKFVAFPFIAMITAIAFSKIHFYRAPVTVNHKY
ncbi:hypothetical protein FE810_09220 [Thalassotalea litorea]|uniref:Uncharacterized protein n=1 Tax=Thalassotalea litorea TaxID=2020715 RepID=A0A5R9IPE6_9GAMM|nr:hypothetical protein [Thalassotalea litorea]TLU65096.1 hypothetical protein FE810_09220 [Thalassotalea litorea]